MCVIRQTPIGAGPPEPPPAVSRHIECSSAPDTSPETTRGEWAYSRMINDAMDRVDGPRRLTPVNSDTLDLALPGKPTGS